MPKSTTGKCIFVFILHFVLFGREPATKYVSGAETKSHLHQFSVISEEGSWEKGAASSGLCGHTEFSRVYMGCSSAAMVSITMVSIKRGKGRKKKRKAQGIIV